MMKFGSIAISLLILVQSFQIGLVELAELDELIEHARFHSEKYGDDLFVFLSKHYGELKAEHSKKHKEEQKEHEELPFQHQLHTSATSAFVLIQSDAITGYAEISPAERANFFYQDSYSSLQKEALLEPPRFP